jgi:predicted neuraminidase
MKLHICFTFHNWITLCSAKYGSDASPSHWKLCWNRNKDVAIKIDPIQLHNSIMCCMMPSVHLIIEQAVSVNNNKRKKMNS